MGICLSACAGFGTGPTAVSEERILAPWPGPTCHRRLRAEILRSAVTVQLVGRRKQSLKRALNSGLWSILPPDGILARDSTTARKSRNAPGDIGV